MFAINRILVPTDLSDLASAALSYACDLARILRAELHVLNVVSLPSQAAVSMAGPIGDSPGTPVVTIPLEDVVAQKTTTLREYVRDAVVDQPVDPVTAVRVGFTAEEIAQYAEEAKIDLIVIGSHARGILKRIFLGSTSKSVLEHARCPVLMVPIAAVNGSPE